MVELFREDQFERIYLFLQAQPKIHVKKRAEIRVFLEAIFWLCRSGAQWRFLPECYGEWNSVYKRFARWNELGIWQSLFHHVAEDKDLQSVMIDSTVVRAQACAAGALKKTVARKGRP